MNVDTKVHDPYLESIVTFTLNRQKYGLRVDEVIELLQMVSITEAPDAPPGMLGYINYRGQVIPLLDLRQVFAVLAQNIRLNSLILVVKASKGLVGLMVDTVEGVETINSEIEDVGSDSVSETKPYLSGIARLQNKLIMMLDVDTLKERSVKFAPAN